MKEKVLPVILILIILGAIGFIVKRAVPQKPTYTMVLVDVQAKKIFKKPVKVGTTINYPVESPYSKSKTAYPVYKCMKCGEIFAFVPYVPKGPEDPNAMNPELMMPKCPKCGAIEVVVPEIPEGKEYIDVQQPEIPIVKPSVK
ncbi:hypothetical protein J7L87_03570 [bacterium]|nr:hypothetical protein [bacterium]